MSEPYKLDIEDLADDISVKPPGLLSGAKLLVNGKPAEASGPKRSTYVRKRKDGESVRFEGILDGIGITAAEAEAMIMQARLAAGIITEEDLAPPAEEGEEDAATDEQEEQEASETPNPA